MPEASEFRLILGSASPRRRELLEGLGWNLEVLPADIVEDVAAGESPKLYLERIVAEKLAAVQARAAELGVSAGVILVADTSVVLDERVLGKPADAAEAASMLFALRGRAHTVMTRYAIGSHCAHERALAERTVCTTVVMVNASDAAIERYANSGEGLDKAGAYAAQGLGAFLIREMHGSHTNVIGLPVAEVVEDLSRLELLGAFP
jgi:septum formation protein